MKRNDETKTAKILVPPELIARAKEGEQAAYTELYETTSPALYRSVRSMVHDEDLAWDIVQESYIRAFRSLDKLGANEAFLPWLRRIAVNETARAAAERRPLRFSELEDEDGELPELPDLRTDGQPELILDRQETSRLVREILADLPEQQNVIVGMRYYEDLSVREISELLKLAPGTVKAQLHRGRKHVEDRVRALEKQGVKLYGLSPMAFLVSLLRRLEPAAGAERTVLGTVLVNTPPAGASVGAAAGTGVGAASGAVTTVTAMTTGQAILHGLGAKIAAGVLCAALIGGGIWAGGRALENRNNGTGDWRPTETRMAVPVETEAPVVTEPAVTRSGKPGSPVDPETEAEIRALLDDDMNINPETMGHYVRALSSQYAEPMDADLNRLFCDFYGTPSDKELEALKTAHAANTVTGREWDPSWDSREWSIVTRNEADTVLTEIFGINLEDYSRGNGVDLARVLGLTWTYLPDYDCYYAHLYSTGLRSIHIQELRQADDGRIFVNYCYADYDGPEHWNLGEEMTAVLRTVDGRYLILANLPRDTVLADPDAIGTETEPVPPAVPEPTEAPLPEKLSGRCGDDLTWRFDPETEILSFDGSGEMDDYGEEHGVYPEWYAFASRIRAVELPEGLTRIGGGAFYGCNALTEVTIPDSVMDGADAFRACSSLTEFHVGAGNPMYCTLDGVLFDKDRRSLIVYPAGKRDASYEIPEGVRNLGYNAFDGCEYLTEVTLPDSLSLNENYITWPPFLECPSLTAIHVSSGNSCVSSLDGVLFTKDRTILLEYPSGKKEASYEIPEGVKSLEDGAFWKCAFLTELTVPDSVTDIDLCAFTDCTALTDIQVSPGNSNFSSLDGVLFDKDRTRLITYPCGKKDASYGIPAGVESIDYHAFADCNFLTEVTIPDSVTDIGVDAFILCTGLARVNFGNGVTNLRAEAFFRCTALKNVTIPDSVKSIEYGALGMEAFVGEYKKLADFTIYGQPGSEAQRYAEENGFAFVQIS